MESPPFEGRVSFEYHSRIFVAFGCAYLVGGSITTGIWHTRQTVTDFIHVEGSGAKIIGILLLLCGITGLVWIWFGGA